MATDDELMDAIAATAIGVEGVNPEAIYSLGGSGTVAGVKDVPDDIGVALPAFLVMDGGLAIQAVAGERVTWTLEATLWAEYSARAERLRALMRTRAALIDAFRAVAKGNRAALPAPDESVQSVLVTSATAPESRKWAAGETQPTYLVVTFSIEVKINRPSARYIAA